MTAGEVSDDQVMLQYNMLSVCEEADHTEMILSCSDMNDDFIYYKLQHLSTCTLYSDKLLISQSQQFSLFINSSWSYELVFN